MPYNFSLSKDGQVLTMGEVDNLIRKNVFNFPLNDGSQSSLFGWHELIGFNLAMGEPWQYIVEKFKDDTELLRIIAYMQKTFQVKAWTS